MGVERNELLLFGLDIRQLWLRWCRGLDSLLPVSLATIFLRPAPKVRATMTGNEIHIEASQTQGRIELSYEALELLEDGSLYGQVTAGLKDKLLRLELILPEQQVLRRTVKIPVAARNNLKKMMFYQVSRLTPFTAEQALFDVVDHGVRAEGDLLEVELLVTSKSFAERWKGQLERVTGLEVVRLGVPEGVQDSDVNLLAGASVSSLWWRRFNLNSLLLVALLASLLVLAVAPIVKLRMEVVRGAQEINSLQQIVADSRDEWHTLQQSAARLAAVLDEHASHIRPSLYLNELARIIPDTIFITSLQLDVSGIQISGSGKHVVDLIDVLNGSSLFEQAKFVSAVTRGQGDLEEFTVAVKPVHEGRLQ